MVQAWTRPLWQHLRDRGARNSSIRMNNAGNVSDLGAVGDRKGGERPGFISMPYTWPFSVVNYFFRRLFTSILSDSMHVRFVFQTCRVALSLYILSPLSVFLIPIRTCSCIWSIILFYSGRLEWLNIGWLVTQDMHFTHDLVTISTSLKSLGGLVFRKTTVKNWIKSKGN